MPAKFEIFKGSRGKYRFRLKAANNAIIAQSEGYNSKASCMRGIKSIKKNAHNAKIEDNTK